MAEYPSNIFLIFEEEFENYLFTGGKVVYIAEDVDPLYKSHPAIITAGALLPPIDGIEAELDGRMLEACSIYEKYLLTEEADMYVSILLAAAIQQIPVAIMFGKDEMNMQFPKMFIDFMYHHYGLVFGVNGSVPSYIMESMMPVVLAKLYMMNMIDYRIFMEKHPPLPIHPMVISRLIYDHNPAVKIKDLPHYVEYFENMRQIIYKNKGRFLLDPMVGI